MPEKATGDSSNVSSVVEPLAGTGTCWGSGGGGVGFFASSATLVATFLRSSGLVLSLRAPESTAVLTPSAIEVLLWRSFVTAVISAGLVESAFRIDCAWSAKAVCITVGRVAAPPALVIAVLISAGTELALEVRVTAAPTMSLSTVESTLASAPMSLEPVFIFSANAALTWVYTASEATLPDTAPIPVNISDVFCTICCTASVFFSKSGSTSAPSAVVAAGSLVSRLVPGGRLSAAMICSCDTPAAISVVSGVTTVAPAGARNCPTKGSPVSALVPPEASTVDLHAGEKTKFPLMSV